MGMNYRNSWSHPIDIDQEREREKEEDGERKSIHFGQPTLKMTTSRTFERIQFQSNKNRI